MSFIVLTSELGPDPQ